MDESVPALDLILLPGVAFDIKSNRVSAPSRRQLTSSWVGVKHITTTSYIYTRPPDLHLYSVCPSIAVQELTASRSSIIDANLTARPGGSDDGYGFPA